MMLTRFRSREVDELLFGFVTKAYIMDDKIIKYSELDEGYVDEEEDKVKKVEKMANK